MAKNKSDIAAFLEWFKSITLRQYLIFSGVLVSLVVVNFIAGLQNVSIDTTDYKAVGDNYLRSNSIVAKVLGKVESISHIGVGGSSGKASYNVYNVRGDKQTGACYLTLKKYEDDTWYVERGTLTSKGREYNLPVRRPDDSKLPKLF